MSDRAESHNAIVSPSRWLGWIWAIPIAASGIAVWLSVRSWSSTGPSVTVVFPIIANLKPDDTQVKFKDMNVGKVESVELENDLRHMRVKLAFN